jgi:3-ketosteroid 9alpha-monooxygenase subunit B
MTAAFAPRPLRKYESRCVDVVQETHDTVTLYFDIGCQPIYRAGQFVSIDPHQFAELSRQVAYFEHIKGKKEQIRAYSMSSAPAERHVSITVKAEGFHADSDKYPPLLSPFLASTRMTGRPVIITGFTGAYTLPDDVAARTPQVLHFCAGSGIVPNYALLKDELFGNKNPSVKHTMVYVNKTADDIIFLKELEDLRERFSDRFELYHCLTRQDPSGRGDHWRQGRPTLDWVKSLVSEPAKLLVYACGAAVTKWQREAAKTTGIEPTPRFMEGVHEIVTGLGVDRPRFKREEFG